MCAFCPTPTPSTQYAWNDQKRTTRGPPAHPYIIDPTDIAGHPSSLIAPITSEARKSSKSDTEKKADAAFNEMHDVAAMGHPSSIHP